MKKSCIFVNFYPLSNNILLRHIKQRYAILRMDIVVQIYIYTYRIDIKIHN